MGNTIPPNELLERYRDEEAEGRRRTGRSNVIYHVMLNRGDPDGSSTEIRREEINPNQNVRDVSEEESDDEEEAKEEISSEEEEDRYEVNEQMDETLDIISQLLGIGIGGGGLRQRHVCMCISTYVYICMYVCMHMHMLPNIHDSVWVVGWG